jgi:uncharacterized protein (TIGR03086 family)
LTDEFWRFASSDRVRESYGQGATIMSEISERYRKVAGQFSQRVKVVPDKAWDNPSPCAGWVARDIVGHLVEWLPAFFFGAWGIDYLPGPSVDRDPVGAWEAVNRTIQAALDDPEIAGRERDTRMGRSTFERTIAMICTGDILIHTWDLARATGLDETLDPDEVHRFVEELEPMDQIIRQSGQYGPRVSVADGADEQTRLIGFVGRRP